MGDGGEHFTPGGLASPDVMGVSCGGGVGVRGLTISCGWSSGGRDGGVNGVVSTGVNGVVSTSHQQVQHLLSCHVMSCHGGELWGGCRRG